MNFLNFFRLKVLDKYLLKKYLVSVLYFIFIFIIISVSIDYSEKSDSIAGKSVSRKEMFTYFGAFIPHIISLLLPIFVFISTIFFVSKLANKTEFIPMFSSGISMRRLLRPFFIGSIIISLILWYANFTFLPKMNKIKSDFLIKYIDWQPEYTNLTNYSIKIDSNRTLEIKNYNINKKLGTNVSIYNTDNSFIKEIIRADSITWDSINKNWILNKIVKREFLENKEKITIENKFILKTFLSPKDFNYDSYLKEKLSKKELKQKIIQEEIKGSSQINTFKIELYKRDSTPFSIIILTFIGVIMSSKKIRGGSGIQLALGMIISTIYVAIDRFSTVFSTNSGLSPILAAWLPNFVFIFITFFLYKKSQQ